MIAKANLFGFKADKLHWRTGLRVVVALIVLGVLGLTKYWPAFSAGTFYVGMSDIMTLKDPIGYRMRRLSIITLVGALLTALGLVLGVNWVLAVLSTFLISLLLGASLAWGKPAALAAYLLNIWFIVSLSLQGGAAQALPQALAWLIGTILAAALATVLLVSLHNQYLIAFIIMAFAFLACFLQDSFSRGFLVSMTGFAYAHRNREKSKNEQVIHIQRKDDML